MSSFFKRTLQEHNEPICFLSACVDAKTKLIIFFREISKNVKIWKILLFRQACDHLRNFSKKLQIFLLKTPVEYRIQSFVNCKNAREVYKKVSKKFEIK